MENWNTSTNTVGMYLLFSDHVKSPKQNIIDSEINRKKSAISICAKTQNARMNTPKKTLSVVSTMKNPPILKI